MTWRYSIYAHSSSAARCLSSATANLYLYHEGIVGIVFLLLRKYLHAATEGHASLQLLKNKLIQ